MYYVLNLFNASSWLKIEEKFWNVVKVLEEPLRFSELKAMVYGKSIRARRINGSNMF
jgi:hypothetical protein